MQTPRFLASSLVKVCIQNWASKCYQRTQITVEMPRHPGLSRCDWKVLEMLGPWPMMPPFHYHSQNPPAQQFRLRFENQQTFIFHYIITMAPVAVVTGANSGLGLALAVKLASKHRVFAGMRSLAKKDSLMRQLPRQRSWRIWSQWSWMWTLQPAGAWASSNFLAF